MNYGPLEYIFPFLEHDLAWINNNFFRDYYATDFKESRVIWAGDKNVFDESINGLKFNISSIAKGADQYDDGQEEWYEGPVWD